MNPTRLYCGLLCLFLLFGCGFGCGRPGTEDRPPVHVTYTPDPTAAPRELLVSAPELTAAPTPDPREAALLYAGERISLYQTSRQDRPGLYMEAVNWGLVYTSFQELPYTAGQQELNIIKVDIRPEGDQAEAYVCVYYQDDAGTARIVCADQTNPNYTLLYPLSTEPGLGLTEEQRQYYSDLMLMGYLYEHVKMEKDRLTNPDNWESLCQHRILDALYYNYSDVLPPYLAGVGTYGSDQHAVILSQAELEAFFQSTVGRPCLALLDFKEEDRKYFSDLPLDQIVLYPTDFCWIPQVKQAVRELDGTITLYGYISGFEMLYCDVVCCIRPVEGHLGGQVVSTEICPSQRIANGSTITFAP